MTDLILWSSLLLSFYLCLTIFYYLFGRSGIFCFVAITTILSKILILKKVIIFEQNANLTTITFLSILFSLNLITEKYNPKSASKCTTLGMLINITFVLMINFTLVFQHNTFDTLNIHFKILFYNTSYTALTVIGTYIIYICQNVNIYLYTVLKRKNMKVKWIKHNLTRLISLLMVYTISKAYIYITPNLYRDYNINCIMKGSWIFIIIIMVIDSPIYYFLNSIKVQEA
ncbi:queuosine precursor transporter [Borrelia sp. A-FGy1]|uniref:queuosine precursor transporter n=1 Tax=Borrelia sp. A-FGy1 TaxID=2608247 RepID=UPI0015F43DB0|nr:queuosine precursor transporter [Borrelia sp. A-FGy1]QMU98865.1 queuosine precursor transporter [Borrelia sp. A-FGy1]